MAHADIGERKEKCRPSRLQGRTHCALCRAVQMADKQGTNQVDSYACVLVTTLL